MTTTVLSTPGAFGNSTQHVAEVRNLRKFIRNRARRSGARLKPWARRLHDDITAADADRTAAGMWLASKGPIAPSAVYQSTRTRHAPIDRFPFGF